MTGLVEGIKILAAVNMINIRQLKWWAPEIYILASVIYYWYMTGTLFNIPAIVLLFFVTILILSKNSALGVVFGVIFMMLNLYMVLAMISELSEFTSFNGNAVSLLTVGTAYLGLNIFMAIRMLIKWGSTDHKPAPQG